MSRESYVATVTGWRVFLDALDEELAKAPEIERQVAELAAMYIRAQQLVSERNALMASMQAATRELQGILQNGRITASHLHRAIRFRFGRDSDKLIQFGLKPARKRSRRRKAAAPKE